MSEPQKKKKHHHHKHVCSGESGWLWLLLFLVFAFIIFLAFTPLIWPQPYPYWNGSDHKDAFVFKKKSFRLAQKRTDCMTAEQWDSELHMCAPRKNAPLSFEPHIVNASISACDSFFGNMCGIWNAEHTNEDRMFSYGYYKSEHKLEKIVKTAARGSPIHAFYTSCVQMNRSDAETQLEYSHLIQTISNTLRSYGDLPVTFGRLARQGYTSAFTFSIERHPTEPRMIPLVTWDGFSNMSLPLMTSLYERTRGVHKLSMPYMTDKIRRAWKVIQAINAHNFEPIDGILDYESYIMNDFPNDQTIFPKWSGWRVFLSTVDGNNLQFAPTQTVWVIGRQYLTWLFEEALQKFELNDWRAFVDFSILYNTHQFAPVLPSNVYFKHWDREGPLGPHSQFYNRLQRSALSPSLKDCTEMTQLMLPGFVAQEYLRSIPQAEEIKKVVREMTKYILTAYSDIIRATSWLSQSGKEAALQKVAGVGVRILEPDEWEPEPFGEQLSSDRFDHNMNTIRRYRVQRNLQLWHKDAPNRSAIAFFAMPLSEVNAYYSGPSNKITMLAGILEEQFYAPNYNIISRYAVIGSIIGHELGHMLDVHGLSWDQTGSFKVTTIWDKPTLKEFNERVKCVIKEFEHGCPDVDYGSITLAENMADLVGIRSSFKAMLLEAYEKHIMLSNEDKKHFFMAFAQAWCSSYEPELLCRPDVHAIAEYRVDHTLKNTVEFGELFGCQINKVCTVYG